MRKILEVLRLHHEGSLSHREIARVVHASPTTVGEILRRAKLAGVPWPLPATLSEAGLEAQLYPPAAPSSQVRAEPNWPAVHRELRQKGVTITGLSRLTRATGAVVVPCITRQEGGGYVTRFYPAWENYPSDDVAADTRRMNAFIEARIREMPAQYFWLHKRFKTRPTGEASLYE